MAYFNIEIDGNKSTEDNLRELHIKLGYLSLKVITDPDFVLRKLSGILLALADLRKEVSYTLQEYEDALCCGANARQAEASVKVYDLLALVNQFGCENAHNGERLCEIMIVE